MRLSCQTKWLSTALPAFLQSLRYVSAYTVTQLPFLCPRYRLSLRRRLWSPLLLSCFFLVWSALRKFTHVHQWVYECPSFPYFLLFFSGLHFVTCDSPFFSLYSTLFVVASVLRMVSVTLPLFERYLNWVDDPAPPPSRYHCDLTSPAPSGDHGISPSNKENTPPQDAPRKIPRKLWPRRRKERQPGSTINQNSPSWKAGSGTQCVPTANRNSASQEIGSATQPGSTANHNSVPGGWLSDPAEFNGQ